jgi:hypothetical protein
VADVFVALADNLKQGESTTLDVILSMPIDQVSVPPIRPNIDAAMKKLQTRDGKSISVYFVPPKHTLLTLQVDAPNFEVTYAGGQVKEVRISDTEVSWAATLKATSNASGRQTILLSISQDISGEELPDEIIRSYTLENKYIEVKSANSKSTSEQVFSIAQWGIPAVLLPLITLVVGIIGRESIVRVARRTYRRLRGKPPA